MPDELSLSLLLLCSLPRGRLLSLLGLLPIATIATVAINTATTRTHTINFRPWWALIDSVFTRVRHADSVFARVWRLMLDF